MSQGWTARRDVAQLWSDMYWTTVYGLHAAVSSCWLSSNQYLRSGGVGGGGRAFLMKSDAWKLQKKVDSCFLHMPLLSFLALMVGINNLSLNSRDRHYCYYFLSDLQEEAISLCIMRRIFCIVTNYLAESVTHRFIDAAHIKLNEVGFVCCIFVLIMDSAWPEGAL